MPVVLDRFWCFILIFILLFMFYFLLIIFFSSCSWTLESLIGFCPTLGFVIQFNFNLYYIRLFTSTIDQCLMNNISLMCCQLKVKWWSEALCYQAESSHIGHVIRQSSVIGWKCGPMKQPVLGLRELLKFYWLILVFSFMIVYLTVSFFPIQFLCLG